MGEGKEQGEEVVGRGNETKQCTFVCNVHVYLCIRDISVNVGQCSTSSLWYGRVIISAELTENIKQVY